MYLPFSLHDSPSGPPPSTRAKNAWKPRRNSQEYHMPDGDDSVAPSLPPFAYFSHSAPHSSFQERSNSQLYMTAPNLELVSGGFATSAHSNPVFPARLNNLSTRFRRLRNFCARVDVVNNLWYTQHPPTVNSPNVLRLLVKQRRSFTLLPSTGIVERLDSLGGAKKENNEQTACKQMDSQNKRTKRLNKKRKRLQQKSETHNERSEKKKTKTGEHQKLQKETLLCFVLGLLRLEPDEEPP